MSKQAPEFFAAVVSVESKRGEVTKVHTVTMNTPTWVIGLERQDDAEQLKKILSYV